MARLSSGLKGCRRDSYVAARRIYLQCHRQAWKRLPMDDYDDYDDAEVAAHDLAEDLVAAAERAFAAL